MKSAQCRSPGWPATAAALLLALFATLPAAAQPYPARPVRFVIGFPPGGTPDVFARLIARKMSESWGTVIVENRVGATGNIAAEHVARSAPDGHTVFYTDSTNFAINPHLFAKLPYDPLKDLAPVILTSVLPTFLAIHPSVPASTLAEFIDHAKRNPGRLAYASIGAGSIHHITSEYFRSTAGLELVHVPYKGGAAAGQAVLTGEVQLVFLSYTALAQHAKAGKVKILAISMTERSAALPDVPTFTEAGLPGFTIWSSLGALVPAGTPPEIIAGLKAGIAAAAAHPEVEEKMTGFGVKVIRNGTPEQFGQVIREEHQKFGRLVKLAGAKME